MTMQISTTAGFTRITQIPFDVDAGIAGRARIGLIVLATDHTMEYEYRQVVTLPGVAFYESRIPNSPTILSLPARLILWKDIAKPCQIHG